MKKLFQITCNAGRETIQPVLSFRVGARHFSYSVSDHSSGELKQLVYYSGNELDEHFLQQLLTSHSELSAPYYQVLVCFDHTQNTFVPLKHYNHEDASVHLKTLFDVNGGYTVVSESVPEWQMYNIYAVPAQVYEWFRRKYMAARVWHQGSIGIKKLNISTSPAQMLVDFRIDDFTVMAFERNNLLLAQSYNYSTPEDVLYQLLKICGQLGFSTESVQVALSGLIDRESALYKDLYLYFLHAGFRDAEWKVDSKDYPAHFFTSLNDLARCAS